MNYTTKDEDNIREVILSGHIKSLDRLVFVKLLENFVKSNLTTLILDLSNTKTIDSAGLGFILIAKQALHDNNKKLILKNPSKHVQQTFSIINFDKIFDIRD